MKLFFKVLAAGLDVLTTCACGVASIIIGIIAFSCIPEVAGWTVTLLFIVGLVGIALGIFFIWLLGWATIDKEVPEDDEE